jgi:enediyne biosynthesis protein E4
MRRRAGRWSAIIVPAIVVGGLGWCGLRWWNVRRDRIAMAEIDDALRHGWYATASRELSAVLDQSPGSDRARYLLGVCENARGRPREADAAWAAVASDSPFIGRAVEGRMDLLVQQGQLADAERLVERAAADIGSEASASAIRLSLVPSLVQEGRAEEARRLVESRWRSLDAVGEGAPEQAANLARLHMELRSAPPSEPLRDNLDRLSRLAPDDDRIWLARANLAIRSGSYDEGRRLLDDCFRRHPDDAAVWRAKLEWSLRTNQLAEARAALEKVPPDLTTPAEVHRLAAVLASRCGDLDRERRELAALVADAPEDLEAIERLAAMEPPAAETTAALRRRKAEIERDQRRYRELYRRNQPARDAEELARLAEHLGHRFEAILFLTVAIAEEPDRAELRADLHRLKEAAGVPDGRIQGLVDRLPNDCGGDKPPSRRASQGDAGNGSSFR